MLTCAKGNILCFPQDVCHLLLHYVSLDYKNISILETSAIFGFQDFLFIRVCVLQL